MKKLLTLAVISIAAFTLFSCTGKSKNNTAAQNETKKQEEKRSIIDKGLMQAKKYCWDDESEKVYAALMQAAEQN